MAGILLQLWWIWGLLASVFLVRWLIWMWINKYGWRASKLYILSLDTCMLEIIIPDALEKTPQGMEQVFRTLQGVGTTFTWWQSEAVGMKQDTFSFEIVSFGGEVHYIIRTIRANRNMLESALYAHFPEIEIFEVEDYTKNVPFKDNEPTEEWDFWAEEMELTEPSFFPIRSYHDFDVQSGKDAYLSVDPLGTMLETLANIAPDEEVWIQYIISPANPQWKDEGRAWVDEKVRGESDVGKSKNKGFGGIILMIIAELWDWVVAIFRFFFNLGEVDPEGQKDDKKDDKKTGMLYLAPGEQDAVKAVERNLGEPGWYTVIRFVIVTPQGKMTSSQPSNIMAAFEQFGDAHINSLVYNRKMTPFTKWFPKDIFNARNFYLMMKYDVPYPTSFEQVAHLRKRENLRAYKGRKLGKQQRGHNGGELTPTSLATLFHFPIASVATPSLPRVDARRASPPARLPTK